MMDSLTLIPVSTSKARLGAWGTLSLEGPHIATLQLRLADNLELPEEVARDLTSGLLLLNNELGRLLFLPYAAASIAAFDLGAGELLAPVLHIPRDPDRGMRVASARLVPTLGVLLLTETVMALYNEDCTVSWLEIGEFGGWGIEATRPDEIQLVFEDWSGNVRRQAWELATGRRLR